MLGSCALLLCVECANCHIILITQYAHTLYSGIIKHGTISNTDIRFRDVYILITIDTLSMNLKLLYVARSGASCVCHFFVLTV